MSIRAGRVRLTILLVASVHAELCGPRCSRSCDVLAMETDSFLCLLSCAGLTLGDLLGLGSLRLAGSSVQSSLLEHGVYSFCRRQSLGSPSSKLFATKLAAVFETFNSRVFGTK